MCGLSLPEQYVYYMVHVRITLAFQAVEVMSTSPMNADKRTSPARERAALLSVPRSSCRLGPLARAFLIKS